MSVTPVTQTMKKENLVFSALRAETIVALSKFGIIDGVDVRRFAQANISTGDKLVLLNLIDTKRVGMQAFLYDRNAVRKDEWIEQMSWQFSCIKRMLKTDTVNTVTSTDICSCLIGWFNGQGMINLRKQHIATLPIDERDVMLYNDNSDFYQRRPVFTMNIQIVNGFGEGTPWTNTLLGDPKHV